MEIVLDYELAEQQPVLEYPHLPEDFSHHFFAGYIIKNRYDEERLSIHKKLNPTRFAFNTNNGVYKLYGILKEASPNHKLIDILTQKQRINIGEYNALLTLSGLSCLTCFLHFSPGLYPIDINYLNRFFPTIDDSLYNNKMIIPNFQRIGNIYLFALINHKKKL